MPQVIHRTSVGAQGNDRNSSSILPFPVQCVGAVLLDLSYRDFFECGSRSILLPDRREQKKAWRIRLGVILSSFHSPIGLTVPFGVCPENRHSFRKVENDHWYSVLRLLTLASPTFGIKITGHEYGRLLKYELLGMGRATLNVMDGGWPS